MKLALIIALSPDRRSGRVLSDILPADQAIDKVKRVITDNECPDARFPIIRAISLDAKLREHRFRVTAADIAEDSQPDDQSGAAFLGDLIPVEIGEGEQLVVINVTTEDEAEFLRDLAGAAISASTEIPRLQGLLSASQKQSEEMATANQRLASYEQELKDKAVAFVKQEAAAAAAITEIARLGLIIDARNADIESCKTDVIKRDDRIKELETQLAETVSKAKKK